MHRVVCGVDQAVQFAGEVGGLLVESAQVFLGAAELGAGVGERVGHFVGCAVSGTEQRFAA